MQGKRSISRTGRCITTIAPNAKNKTRMKNILLDQVLQQVQNKEISIEKARELICVLFNVVGQSEQLVCKGKCDHGYKDEEGNELFCSIKKAN